MARFSKFFFLLFTLLTICPLLAFFGWNRYQMALLIDQRQERSLSEGEAWITHAYATVLRQEESYLKDVQAGFSGAPLTREQYKILFATQNVTETPIRVDKAGVDTLLREEPVTKRLVPLIRFILPLAQKPGKGVVIEKPFPCQRLRPPGPYAVFLYGGNSLGPEALLETLNDSPPPLTLKTDTLPSPARKDIRSERWALENSPSRQFVLRSRSHVPVMTVVLKSPVLLQIQKDQEKSGFWPTVLILFSGCFISLLAGKYLNRNFVDPLMLLSVATGKVQKGQLDVQIDTASVNLPEVMTTLENFNRMVRQLAEKENLKKNFISNLTHDLRTPLIAQESALDLLMKKFRKMDPEAQESFFASLLKNNRHLLGMVNQLLETYQFEEGKIRLLFQPVNLKEMVTGCYEQLQPLADERKIQLLQNIPESIPLLNADVQCLGRVFNNLIGNAIENIPKGSQVQVSAMTHADRVEIHVRDNGQGIPEASLNQVFERYVGGYGETRKIGTGFGLYICKMFIDAHHGSISVESSADQYTDFKIEIPLNLRNEQEEAS